jgi:hypothetical protein
MPTHPPTHPPTPKNNNQGIIPGIKVDNHDNALKQFKFLAHKMENELLRIIPAIKVDNRDGPAPKIQIPVL